jgi:hypothetical protein
MRCFMAGARMSWMACESRTQVRVAALLMRPPDYVLKRMTILSVLAGLGILG